jgi:hypothetical protein
MGLLHTHGDTSCGGDLGDGLADTSRSSSAIYTEWETGIVYRCEQRYCFTKSLTKHRISNWMSVSLILEPCSQS